MGVMLSVLVLCAAVGISYVLLSIWDWYMDRGCTWVVRRKVELIGDDKAKEYVMKEGWSFSNEKDAMIYAQSIRDKGMLAVITKERDVQ